MVANGDVTDTVGAISNLNIFDTIEVPLDVRFDAIIGLSTLEALQVCIDLGLKTATIEYDLEEVKLSLQYDPSRNFLPDTKTNSEDITTLSDTESSPESSYFIACFQDLFSDD